jgi:hypothetical protein
MFVLLFFVPLQVAVQQPAHGTAPATGPAAAHSNSIMFSFPATELPNALKLHSILVAGGCTATS